MTETPALTPESPVTLVEITAETVIKICKLSDTLREPQNRMVASNAISIAQAHFNEHAWFRAIYAANEPVGFVMLYIGPNEDSNPNDEQKTVYFLWRYMIASPYQKLGFGQKAIQLVVEYVRSLGASELLVSCGQGEGSPEGFYRRLGFTPTGEFMEAEMVLKLALEPAAEPPSVDGPPSTDGAPSTG